MAKKLLIQNSWNEMSQAERFAILLSAGIQNVTFKFLEWTDLPQEVRLLIVEKGKY